MELQTLLAFTLVAVVVELVPGPNFFLLVRTVPNSGLASGFGNIGGFASAFMFHGGLAAFGISAVIAASPAAFATVKLLGGIYLMGTGTQTLFDLFNGLGVSRRERNAMSRVHEHSSVADAAVDPRSGVAGPAEGYSRRSWRRVGLAVGDGFVTNLFNPKIALFYIAAFPSFIGASIAPAEALSLVFVHVCVAVAWFSLVALFFVQLTQALSSDRASRWLTGISGVMFVVLGAGVVTS